MDRPSDQVGAGRGRDAADDGIIRIDVALGTAPAGSAKARDAVRHALGAVAEEVVDVACLLTGELVSNALLHAGSVSDMTILLAPGSITVEVADGSLVAPERRGHGPESLNGRGLDLLDRLATEWGTMRSPAGKTVWFRLDLP